MQCGADQPLCCRQVSSYRIDSLRLSRLLQSAHARYHAPARKISCACATNGRRSFAVLGHLAGRLSLAIARYLWRIGTITVASPLDLTREVLTRPCGTSLAGTS